MSPQIDQTRYKITFTKRTKREREREREREKKERKKERKKESAKKKKRKKNEHIELFQTLYFPTNAHKL